MLLCIKTLVFRSKSRFYHGVPTWWQVHNSYTTFQPATFPKNWTERYKIAMQLKLLNIFLLHLSGNSWLILKLLPKNMALGSSGRSRQHSSHYTLSVFFFSPESFRRKLQLSCSLGELLLCPALHQPFWKGLSQLSYIWPETFPSSEKIKSNERQ